MDLNDFVINYIDTPLELVETLWNEWQNYEKTWYIHHISIQ